MRFLEKHRLLVLSMVIGLLGPIPAFAQVNGSVPEPFTLALLAGGFAGLGAAELIRRRKNK